MADHSTQSQYAAAARIPLIKSPAVRVPPPVELPPDIHPLPDSVTPYFAYPFVLEPHTLTLESSRRNALATYAARRQGVLRAREDAKERQRRDALRRVAPGFDGNVGAALEPEPAGAGVRGGAAPAVDADVDKSKRPRGDVMDDLVEQLERMAGSTRASGADAGGT